MESGEVTIEDIAQILAAINDFDVTIVTMLICSFLIFFILGFTAGTVAKLLKRA